MKRAARSPAMIDVVEAAYSMDSDDTEWLDAIVQRSAPLLDDGFGVFAFTYDASTPDQMMIGRFAPVGHPHAFRRDERARRDHVRGRRPVRPRHISVAAGGGNAQYAGVRG